MYYYEEYAQPYCAVVVIYWLVIGAQGGCMRIRKRVENKQRIWEDLRYMFRVAAHTDIGPRKQSNQDSCCALVAKTPFGDCALLSVCDGVGGLASGELASASVVNWLISWFEDVLPQQLALCNGDAGYLFDAVQESWETGLYNMNDALRRYGRDNDTQLGTTCTTILLFKGSYLIVHVGDSRVYRFSGGHMDILTIDQTWVAQEVARGNIPPEKARSHPKRNVILQSVGTQSELQPVFGRGGYEIGDAFMVCCDGFRNELFDDELIDAFGGLQTASERDIHDVIEATIKLVLNRGERDNITAVACSVQQGNDYNPTSEQVEVTATVRFDDPDDPKTTILPQVEHSDDLRAGGIA